MAELLSFGPTGWGDELLGGTLTTLTVALICPPMPSRLSVASRSRCAMTSATFTTPAL